MKKVLGSLRDFMHDFFNCYPYAVQQILMEKRYGETFFLLFEIIPFTVPLALSFLNLLSAQLAMLLMVSLFILTRIIYAYYGRKYVTDIIEVKALVEYQEAMLNIVKVTMNSSQQIIGHFLIRNLEASRADSSRA